MNHIPDPLYDDGPNYPILFEDGDWRLYRVEYKQSPVVRSYISHRCAKQLNKAWRWLIANMGTPCSACDEMPPDGMVALHRLHNWNYIEGLK